LVNLIASAAGAAARQVQIISPFNIDVILTAGGVTLGTSQATVAVNTDTKVFDVFAQNPGLWADDVGVKVVSIDSGTPQRQKLTFSEALVASNSFTITIDSIPLSPAVTYASNSDTTMTAIAAAIQAALTGSTVSVVPSTTGTNTDARVIIIVAPDSLENVALSAASVSAGTTQPTIVITETITRIPSDNTFVLEVYKRANINVAVEKFTVSLLFQTDGYGRAQNIGDVINTSAARSNLIRVAQYVANDTGLLLSVDTDIQWLGGGDDGAAVTSAGIVTEWNNEFSDPEDIAVRVLINAGYTAVAVQQKMVSLAESRRDCFAILDMPSDLQSMSDAISYRLNDLNINSSYGAIYTPDLNILDIFSDRTRYIPPSGHVAAAYARTDRVRATWFAPAGLNVGQIYNILNLRTRYNQAARDQMSPVQINTIVKKPGQGWVIWDAETLQARASALSNINVRRLLIVIEVSLANALDYNVFDPNDEFTRFLIRQSVNAFLQPIKDGRGLYEFEVICDNSNNKANDIDSGELNVDVYLKPVIPARFIRLQTIITSTGASFQEIIKASNGGNF
jgi:phage tail sheath protein FI